MEKIEALKVFNTLLTSPLALKACPHCRREVRLSQKSATVAVVSPLSATVALFCDSLIFLRQCGQGFRKRESY